MKERTVFRYNGLMPRDGSLPFLTGTILMLIISLILGIFIKDQNAMSIVYSFTSQIAFALLSFLFAFMACKRDCFGVGHYCLNTLHSLGFSMRAKPKTLLICVALPFFAILAFLPISALVEYVFMLLGYTQTPTYADYTSSAGMFVLCIFALCVAPAFGEEMMIRGALMHGLRAKGTIFAITVSSLMFALMHGSPVQFIHQFLIGLIMAYIVCLTDCLWHSIVFHFCNNFIVILYEYIYNISGASYVIPIWAYAVMFVVGIIGVGGLLILFTKCAIKGSAYKSDKEGQIKLHGKFKGTVIALFNTAEYKYNAYDKKPNVTFYVTFLVIVCLWVFNTIAGWLL